MHRVEQHLRSFFLIAVMICLISASYLIISPQQQSGKAIRALQSAIKDETIPSQLDEGTAPTDGERSAETGIVRTTYISAGVLLASKRSDTSEVEYYITDHLGSNRKLLENGSVEQDNEYYAFGETSTSGEGVNGYKFTGKELDDTGLYYYGARYYLPELGRFLQSDAVEFDTKNPLSLNRYAYTENNPLKYVDPTGNDLNALKELGKGIAVGIGEGIKNIPTAAKAVIKDPALLLDVPGNVIKAARGSFIEGSLFGFGTAKDPYEAGKQASVVIMTLGGLAAGGAGAGGSVSLSLPSITFDISASGAAMLAPAVSTVTISTTGASAAVAGAALMGAMTLEEQTEYWEDQFGDEPTHTERTGNKNQGQEGLFDRIIKEYGLTREEQRLVHDILARDKVGAKHASEKMIRQACDQVKGQTSKATT